MCLWTGIIEIIKQTSLVNKLKKILKPAMKFLFPKIKEQDKEYDEISMNIVANLLGIGNAATPLGIKAMKTMQEKNNKKDTLTNNMVLFIVLNTASIQIIPTTVIAIRNSLGSRKSNKNYYSCMDCNCNCSNMWNCINKNFNKNRWEVILIEVISSLSIPVIILIVIIYGVKEKINTYDAFVKGAKDGAKTVVELFPTLLCLFIGIGALRTSGVIDAVINLIEPLINIIKFPVEVLPLAILRPISGSASMAIATDIMTNYGVDTKIGLIASTIMGSTETTIYTIAVYTSAVKVKNTRFVLYAALVADAIGIITSNIVINLLY